MLAHRTAIRRIADALIELSEANADEEEVRCRANVDGATLKRAAYPNIGDRSDIDSPINCWFRFTRNHGLLDSDPHVVN